VFLFSVGANTYIIVVPAPQFIYFDVYIQAEVTYLKQLMFMNALANAQNPAMLQALATQNPLMAGV
jgi:hypothetical protein